MYLDLSLPSKSLESLLSHIARPTSHFHTTLRHLTLRSEVPPQRSLHNLSGLASIRSLTSLTLSYWYMGMPNSEWFRSAINVKHLTLTCCRLDCFGFRALIKQLPKLESLKVANVSWKDSFNIDGAEKGGCVLEHLRKLHLGPRSSSVVCALTAMISRRIIKGQVEEVELEEVEMGDEKMFGELLEVLGSSLRSLRISVLNMLNNVSRAFALQKNPNLKSIHFADLVDPTHSTSDGLSRHFSIFSISWVLAFLRQLPNSTERITFSFWLISGDKLGLGDGKKPYSINWWKLVETLRPLHELTCVKLRLEAKEAHRRWIMRQLERHFPELKRVLQVTSMHDE
ncbi:hypothetical protein H0H92_009130 [Tricholoma furcatifolium]|nr:hypothetical protein H0H92_009130 [Tricholoma furcatifolium]